MATSNETIDTPGPRFWASAFGLCAALLFVAVKFLLPETGATDVAAPSAGGAGQGVPETQVAVLEEPALVEPTEAPTMRPQLLNDLQVTNVPQPEPASPRPAVVEPAPPHAAVDEPPQAPLTSTAEPPAVSEPDDAPAQIAALSDDATTGAPLRAAPPNPLGLETLEPPDGANITGAAPVDVAEPARTDGSGTADPAEVDQSIPVVTSESLGFDLVRVDAAGAAILAGTAPPGRAVEVVLDGKPVATVESGADGTFAAFFDVPPSIAPMQVALRSAGSTGPEVSAETLIIAPVPPGLPDVAPPADAETAAMPPEAPAPVGDAAAAPRLLIAEASGLKVVQAGGAEPEALRQVSIDTIAYDVAGAVVLTGRGEGAVQVYLDNRPLARVEVTSEGQWQSPLPAIDTGVYTLRVDAVDETGRVTSRAETPFQREDAAKIRALAEDQVSSGLTTDLITVQPGYTLWGIAREAYGQGVLFVRVFDANRGQIRDPHWIYPGQVFELPDAVE